MPEVLDLGHRRELQRPREPCGSMEEGCRRQLGKGKLGLRSLMG